MAPSHPPRPRGSPPSSSIWGAMCDIVTNIEIPPLIFSLYRNRSNRDLVNGPRGSMPTAAPPGGSSQDTKDLQEIKLKM